MTPKVAEVEKPSIRKARTEDEMALANIVAPDLLTPEPIRAAWASWQAYRCERAKRPLSGERRLFWTETAAKADLRQLTHLRAKYGDAAAIEYVNKAITKRSNEIFGPWKANASLAGNPSTMTEEQLKKF